MKIVINRDFCQGHSVCMGEAPEVFEVDDDGNLKLLREDVPPELLEKVRNAAKYCPTNAISLVEEG
jgi:sterol 14-demethylase